MTRYSSPLVKEERILSETGFAASDPYSFMSGGNYDEDYRYDNGTI